MVTRKEIADKAQVSVSVVSRALNNSGYVAPEKKERILRIAQELGYHPSPVAMSLMEKKTRQIVFCNKDLRNTYNIEMYEGMCEAAEQQDYMIVLCGSSDFSHLKGIMADGLILPNEAIAREYLNGEGKNYFLPVVSATYGNHISFHRSIPIIECDLFEGMHKALEYLYSCGHRKIAFVSPFVLENGDARHIAWIDYMTPILGDRLSDYFLGINRTSLGMDPRVLKFPEEAENDRTAEDDYFGKGELAAEVFLERKMDATAVICFNDEMALGFCRRLRDLHIRIPEDVSVMGVDGTYARRYTDWQLTTLVTNPRRHGELCAEVLLNVINERKYKYVNSIPTRIEEGDTVRVISQ